MATLHEVYRTLFAPEQGQDPFESAPLLPADLFAYTAYLLELSGAYHHVVPDVDNGKPSSRRRLLVDNDLRRRTVINGRQWRKARPLTTWRYPSAPMQVNTLWIKLGDSRDDSVYGVLREDAAAPKWWLVCLELMMIADEASLGLGFEGKNPFHDLARRGHLDRDSVSGRQFRRIQSAPFSLSTAANDILCVQAKSRTPSVGCTLRSLSHHLALLPPRGQARVRWIQPVVPRERSPDDDKLGLLLVPFPYRIYENVFTAAGMNSDGKSGWFTANQVWLPRDEDRKKRREFVSFVLGLIQQARQAGQRVDGVVLPELALNFSLFMDLARALAGDGGIDFLISGTSDAKNERQGNFVAIAPFFLLGDERSSNTSGWEEAILVREKHHRWKLDPVQIKAYGFKIADDCNWWENIQILSRSVDILVYRDTMTLTTLICEDLARVDPCQAIIRGIGPNLLIALLMDGPQLATRWPARYASVLADDPGTSVLSFTSYGLIARQNDIAEFPQASAIALWKDEAAGIRVIELPREADAITLQLKAIRKTEHTLDGRSDDKIAQRWQYEAHKAVRVPSSDRPDWIVQGKGR